MTKTRTKLVDELRKRRVEFGMEIKELAWQMNLTYGCAYSLVVRPPRFDKQALKPLKRSLISLPIKPRTEVRG